MADPNTPPTVALRLETPPLPLTEDELAEIESHCRAGTLVSSDFAVLPRLVAEVRRLRTDSGELLPAREQLAGAFYEGLNLIGDAWSDAGPSTRREYLRIADRVLSSKTLHSPSRTLAALASCLVAWDRGVALSDRNVEDLPQHWAALVRSVESKRKVREP